jgi:hypothetical protein
MFTTVPVLDVGIAESLLALPEIAFKIVVLVIGVELHREGVCMIISGSGKTIGLQ